MSDAAGPASGLEDPATNPKSIVQPSPCASTSTSGQWSPPKKMVFRVQRASPQESSAAMKIKLEESVKKDVRSSVSSEEVRYDLGISKSKRIGGSCTKVCCSNLKKKEEPKSKQKQELKQELKPTKYSEKLTTKFSVTPSKTAPAKFSTSLKSAATKQVAEVNIKKQQQNNLPRKQPANAQRQKTLPKNQQPQKQISQPEPVKVCQVQPKRMIGDYDKNVTITPKSTSLPNENITGDPEQIEQQPQTATKEQFLRLVQQLRCHEKQDDSHEEQQQTSRDHKQLEFDQQFLSKIKEAQLMLARLDGKTLEIEKKDTSEDQGALAEGCRILNEDKDWSVIEHQQLEHQQYGTDSMVEEERQISLESTQPSHSPECSTFDEVLLGAAQEISPGHHAPSLLNGSLDKLQQALEVKLREVESMITSKPEKNSEEQPKIAEQKQIQKCQSQVLQLPIPEQDTEKQQPVEESESPAGDITLDLSGPKQKLGKRSKHQLVPDTKVALDGQNLQKIQRQVVQCSKTSAENPEKYDKDSLDIEELQRYDEQQVELDINQEIEEQQEEEVPVSESVEQEVRGQAKEWHQESGQLENEHPSQDLLQIECMTCEVDEPESRSRFECDMSPDVLEELVFGETPAEEELEDDENEEEVDNEELCYQKQTIMCIQDCSPAQKKIDTPWQQTMSTNLNQCTMSTVSLPTKQQAQNSVTDLKIQRNSRIDQKQSNHFSLLRPQVHCSKRNASQLQVDHERKVPEEVQPLNSLQDQQLLPESQAEENIFIERNSQNSAAEIQNQIHPEVECQSQQGSSKCDMRNQTGSLDSTINLTDQLPASLQKLKEDLESQIRSLQSQLKIDLKLHASRHENETNPQELYNRPSEQNEKGKVQEQLNNDGFNNLDGVTNKSVENSRSDCPSQKQAMSAKNMKDKLNSSRSAGECLIGKPSVCKTKSSNIFLHLHATKSEKTQTNVLHRKQSKPDSELNHFPKEKKKKLENVETPQDEKKQEDAERQVNGIQPVCQSQQSADKEEDKGKDEVQQKCHTKQQQLVKTDPRVEKQVKERLEKLQQQHQKRQEEHAMHLEHMRKQQQIQRQRRKLKDKQATEMKLLVLGRSEERLKHERDPELLKQEQLKRQRRRRIFKQKRTEPEVRDEIMGKLQRMNGRRMDFCQSKVDICSGGKSDKAVLLKGCVDVYSPLKGCESVCSIDDICLSDIQTTISPQVEDRNNLLSTRRSNSTIGSAIRDEVLRARTSNSPMDPPRSILRRPSRTAIHSDELEISEIYVDSRLPMQDQSDRSSTTSCCKSAICCGDIKDWKRCESPPLGFGYRSDRSRSVESQLESYNCSGSVEEFSIRTRSSSFTGSKEELLVSDGPSETSVYSSGLCEMEITSAASEVFHCTESQLALRSGGSSVSQFFKTEQRRSQCQNRGQGAAAESNLPAQHSTSRPVCEEKPSSSVCTKQQRHTSACQSLLQQEVTKDSQNGDSSQIDDDYDADLSMEVYRIIDPSSTSLNGLHELSDQKCDNPVFFQQSVGRRSKSSSVCAVESNSQITGSQSFCTDTKKQSTNITSKADLSEILKDLKESSRSVTCTDTAEYCCDRFDQDSCGKYVRNCETVVDRGTAAGHCSNISLQGVPMRQQSGKLVAGHSPLHYYGSQEPRHPNRDQLKNESPDGHSGDNCDKEDGDAEEEPISECSDYLKSEIESTSVFQMTSSQLVSSSVHSRASRINTSEKSSAPNLTKLSTAPSGTATKPLNRDSSRCGVRDHEMARLSSTTLRREAKSDAKVGENMKISGHTSQDVSQGDLHAIAHRKKSVVESLTECQPRARRISTKSDVTGIPMKNSSESVHETYRLNTEAKNKSSGDLLEITKRSCDQDSTPREIDSAARKETADLALKNSQAKVGDCGLTNGPGVFNKASLASCQAIYSVSSIPGEFCGRNMSPTSKSSSTLYRTKDTPLSIRNDSQNWPKNIKAATVRRWKMTQSTLNTTRNNAAKSDGPDQGFTSESQSSFIASSTSSLPLTNFLPNNDMKSRTCSKNDDEEFWMRELSLKELSVDATPSSALQLTSINVSPASSISDTFALTNSSSMEMESIPDSNSRDMSSNSVNSSSSWSEIATTKVSAKVYDEYASLISAAMADPGISEIGGHTDKELLREESNISKPSVHNSALIDKTLSTKVYNDRSAAKLSVNMAGCNATASSAVTSAVTSAGGLTAAVPSSTLPASAVRRAVDADKPKSSVTSDKSRKNRCDSAADVGIHKLQQQQQRTCANKRIHGTKSDLPEQKGRPAFPAIQGNSLSNFNSSCYNSESSDMPKASAAHPVNNMSQNNTVAQSSSSSDSLLSNEDYISCEISSTPCNDRLPSKILTSSGTIQNGTTDVKGTDQPKSVVTNTTIRQPVQSARVQSAKPSNVERSNRPRIL